ncbi:MAG: class I SAM-dependent methyltransferase [Alphaproteobacteria bacterium]|nr:class I SAM-dependent methyltransferase [Alphaproteobacteria bacterium]
MNDAGAHIETVRSARDVARIRNLPSVARLVFAMTAQIRFGSLTVIMPDGRAFRFAGEELGHEGTIRIVRMRTFRRLLTGGNIGFAEAYLDGDWECEDVAGFLDAVSRNTEQLRGYFRATFWPRLANRVRHAWNANTRSGARRNIHAHYDLGNAFYERWLDKSMTYSAARFSHPGEALLQAQRNKYRALAERIGLAPGHHVLEIGSGWGGFAEFAAKEIGARVTGITISKEQRDYAQARMAAEGLTERVTIEMRDYRDVEGQFDRIASIEMFEAVGEKYWPAYFGKLRECLKPGGIAGLQVITIGESHFPIYRRGVDFIQKYIFPGGMLPTMSALRREIERAGLEWRDDSAFGHDYAKTLARWRESFLAAWEEIRPLGFDERFKRLWTYYLSYCEAGFRSGSTDVVQIAAQRV